MFSVPSVSLSTGAVSAVTSTYPSLLYPSQTVVNASALTPSTMFPVLTNPLATVPVLPTIGSVSTYPTLAPIIPSVISYQDVNSDGKMRQEMTNYYYDKIVNNWLRFHYGDIYKLFVVSGNSVNLVKDLAEAEANTKSDPASDTAKYHYLVDNYLSKKDVYKLIDKFRKINSINWWDVKQYNDKFRNFVRHKITKYILKQITQPKIAASN
jgi:hypothetical protein